MCLFLTNYEFSLDHTMANERFSYSNITETPKRNALREVTNSVNVSPTANLKLLTKVALRNSYDRKEKSLQILCDRYIFKNDGYLSVFLLINIFFINHILF